MASLAARLAPEITDLHMDTLPASEALQGLKPERRWCSFDHSHAALVLLGVALAAERHARAALHPLGRSRWS